MATQDSPAWIEVVETAVGRYLLAVHEYGKDAELMVGYVSSYRIEPDGALTKISTEPTFGRGNTSVSLDRTGRYALVTRYHEGGVCVLPFDEGVLYPVCSEHAFEGTGPHPARQTMPHPHGFHGDPRSDLVYVLDLGTDLVHQFALDGATGELRPCEVPSVRLPAGSGPRGIVFHPTLRVAYVNCELGGSVVACAVDDARGLSPVQTAHAYPAGYEGFSSLGQCKFWGAEAAITRDGRHLYNICRGDQSLAIFDVDGASGELSLRGRQPLSADGNARNLTLDPAGRYLLVASQDANEVEVFRIEAGGELTRTDAARAPCATDVAVV